MNKFKQQQIGVKINLYRTKKNITKYELSKLMENKTTSKQIKDYELGIGITFPIVADIAKALGVNPRDIYPEEFFMSREIYGKPAPQEEAIQPHKQWAVKGKPLRKNVNEISSEFSKACYNARFKMGKTLESVAKEIGMTTPTITAVEKGTRNVKDSTLIKLAKYYGIDK